MIFQVVPGTKVGFMQNVLLCCEIRYILLFTVSTSLLLSRITYLKFFETQDKDFTAITKGKHSIACSLAASKLQIYVQRI